MQVLNTPAIAANPTTTPTTPTPSSSITDPNAPGSLTNESTFLQLLMAQVQNQDPMNPTDSTQFVGINQGVQTLVTDASTPPATPTTPTTPTSPVTTPAAASINPNNSILQ
jgi:hypothetical protein